MAESSRVEELRKRYHENPRRFFAPLANEYRKAGFLDRAILLCQKHLGEQAGNMNGLIVYGQALFESGRHEEARGPFEAALEVDPANLIALRHLGDIGRLAGNNEDAQKWYGRALEYDRRNDEVRELFEQVGGTLEPRSGVSARPVAAEAPASPPHMPTPQPADPSAKTVEVTPRPLASVKTAEVEARPQRRASLLDIDFDFGETAADQAQAPRVPTPGPPPPPRDPTPPDLPSFDDSDPTVQPVERREEPSTELPWLESVSETPPPSSLSGAFPLDAEFPLEEALDGDFTDLGESLIEPEPEHEPPVATPIEGLQLPDFSADVAPLPDLESSEFPVGQAADVEPLPELETAEFVAPGSAETVGSIIDPEPEPADEPVPDGGDLPLLDMPEVEPAAAEPTFDPTSTVPTPSTAPAIVTETMAELYLEQGFHAEAIEVYRTLIAQDPDDARLKDKLASLERSRASLEFATPTEGLDDVGERAPENAMLSEVSFEDVSSLGTPKTPAGANARMPTPRERKPVQEVASVAGAGDGNGPTAREFFAAFARRSVGARAAGAADTPDAVRESVAEAGSDADSWAVPASESPLDALFGNKVRDDDQRAANRLAGIGTTSAPSGGSNLDALFAVDPGEIVESPSASVPRASEKLKFDQFFSSTSTPPEPRTAEPGPDAGPSAEASPMSDAAADAGARPSPDAPAADQSTEPPAKSSGDQDGDDDLDRFHGWLKGLTE